jgi:hypothetical protein
MTVVLHFNILLNNINWKRIRWDIWKLKDVPQIELLYSVAYTNKDLPH